MPSTYIDCFQYQQQPTGFSAVAYIGNAFRFVAAQSIGTTLSIPTSAIQTPLNSYSNLYIFDGLYSEIVQVSAEVVTGGTSVSLVLPTQYIHAAGVAVCSDGMVGSLGEQIFIASQWIEDICHQSLWASSYVGEVLTLPTMRAAIDNQRNLHVRPRHFPITGVSSISMANANGVVISTFDISKAIVDADQQTIDISIGSTLPSPVSQYFQSGYPFGTRANRATTQWVTLSYAAGYATGSLPWTVRRACVLLTSEMFVQISNPVGSASITQGKRAVVFALRGDMTGESLLVKQATKLITPFIAEIF